MTEKKLKIIAVGGYSEIGRNCTAIVIDDEAIILDMGLHMDNYINFTEDEDMRKFMDGDLLIEHDAVPNVNRIHTVLPKVKAILVTHAHLDHLGAIPFLIDKFPDAKVYGTPYSMEVLKAIFRDEKIKVNNEIISKNVNSKFKISDNFSIEFINMTHSVPQTVMIHVKTKYGDVLYSNDFKFDNNPTLGQKPNYKALEQIGENGNLKALIVDSLYADDMRKTPSEAIAREMLRDVMLGTNSNGRIVLVTTFSSHIARLQSIINLGKKLNRKIVLMGRSLTKYVKAAEDIDLVNFSKDCDIVTYGSQIKRFFKKTAHPEKYLFIVTGHQGEPQSVLGKLINRNWLKFNEGDHIIFSSSIIPVEQNLINREIMENELNKFKVRIFRDVHVSGHAGREDLRDLVSLVKPKFILPAHADIKKSESMKELAMQIGFKPEKIKILKNGEKLAL
jgi:ribonuclease J